MKKITLKELLEALKNLPPETEIFSAEALTPDNAMETQIGGSHYTDMAIQPMEFSMANGLDACQHTIIKYVTRFRSKGGITDLEKAKHVIDMLIGFESREQA